MIVVVMGVTGSGKSTVGKLLANKLSIPFHDADDFHSKENIAKMQNGVPLTDDDRLDWLNSLSEAIGKWNKQKGAVLACSALKERYRQILTSSGIDITWIFLKGNQDLISERLQQRKSHYMNPLLLQSQLDILEEPTYGVHVQINNTPEEIVNKILNQLEK